MPEQSNAVTRRWTVVVLCCVITFVQMGIARLASLLFPAAVDTYGASRTQASLPFLLCHTIRNLSGPFIGFLGQKFGLRAVTVCGSALSSVAVAACFLAEDILTFTVLWGGLYGLGYGFGTILIPQIINQYFKTKSALANGIALGGECLAGFMLPALTEWLLNTYGLSGTMLILSSCLLHSVPSALLLWGPRNPKSRNNEEETKGLLGDADSRRTQNSFTLENSSLSKQTDLHELLEDTQNVDSQSKRIGVGNDVNFFDGENDVKSGKCASFTCDSDAQSNLLKSADSADGICAVLIPAIEQRVSATVISAAEKSNASCDLTSSKPFVPNCPDDISSKSSFHVFLDPTFILIIVTQSSIIFMYTFLGTIIIDFGRDSGVTEKEDIYLLMCLSVGDAIGRFFLGVVTDSAWLTKHHFSALCYAVMGGGIMSLIWFARFEVLMTSLFFFGMSAGGLLSVFPGMCSQFITVEHHTMALASRFLLYAPMSLTQAPLIGYFREHCGSYNGILIILSVNALVCILTSLLTPWASHCRDRKKARTKRTVTNVTEEC